MLATFLMLASLNTANDPLKVEPTVAVAPTAEVERVSQHLLAAGGAEIEVEVHLGQSDLAVDDLLAWVRRAAEAVPGLFELRSLFSI